jgi:hypothetical protein
MNAVTGPDMESLPEDAHLLVPVLERAEREPDRPVAAYRVGPGLQWVTAAEFATRVRALAKLGLGAGGGPETPYARPGGSLPPGSGGWSASVAAPVGNGPRPGPWPSTRWPAPDACSA